MTSLFVQISKMRAPTLILGGEETMHVFFLPPDKEISTYSLHSPYFCAHASMIDLSGWINQKWDFGEENLMPYKGWRKV